MERLSMRGGIDDDEKMRRMRSASMEIQTALDHPAFVLEVNHEVEHTAAELIRGLDISEKSQAKHRQLALQLLESIKTRQVN